MVDLTFACSPYGFALNGLEDIKDSALRAPLQKEFDDCSEKLRVCICLKLQLPMSTTWMDILTKAGWLTTLSEEDQNKGFQWASSIELSGEAEELCEKLEIIRHQITGEI